MMGRIRARPSAARRGLWLLGFGVAGAADAPRHRKAAHLVVVRNGRVDLDFRLVDAVVTDERVDDPPDVPGAPHIT
jgi:hypothetical protein